MVIEEVIIILGYRLTDGMINEILESRLELGLSLYLDSVKREHNSVIVVSGTTTGTSTQAPSKMPSEASVMRRWLVEQGVLEECIYEEDKALDTIQNAVFSLKLIEELSLTSKATLRIVSSDFHITRTSYIFSEVCRALYPYSFKRRSYHGANAMYDCTSMIEHEKRSINRLSSIDKRIRDLIERFSVNH